MKKYLLFLSLISSSLFADMSIPPLTDMMSIEDQKKTGVIRLKQHERKELAKWLTENCFSSKKDSPSQSKDLKISLNIDGGKKLELTDNSVWEIAPSDVHISSSWISEVEVKVYPSGDQEYPYLIVNVRTKRSVKARKSSLIN